jgi:hypothetical protein
MVAKQNQPCVKSQLLMWNLFWSLERWQNVFSLCSTWSHVFHYSFKFTYVYIMVIIMAINEEINYGYDIVLYIPFSKMEKNVNNQCLGLACTSLYNTMNLSASVTCFSSGQPIRHQLSGMHLERITPTR